MRDLNPERRPTQADRFLSFIQKHGWTNNLEVREKLGISRGGTEVTCRLRKIGHSIQTFLDPTGEAVYWLKGEIPQNLSAYAIMTFDGLKSPNDVTEDELIELGLLGKIKMVSR